MLFSTIDARKWRERDKGGKKGGIRKNELGVASVPTDYEIFLVGEMGWLTLLSPAISLVYCTLLFQWENKTSGEKKKERKI